jgi:hypothetical protein
MGDVDCELDSRANYDRTWQRIDGRSRPRSGRRVRVTSLTRRCRARAGARTARPTKDTRPDEECPISRPVIALQ